jgi:hypothetical protein
MTISSPETFKAAWIADLKAQLSVIAPVPAREVREFEFQGTDWTYPCIRLAVEFSPTDIYCGPDDADIEIDVFSEQKSSKESADIASNILVHYHGHPFTQSGIRFNMVKVVKVEKPDRTVPSWVTKVHIKCQGIGI